MNDGHEHTWRHYKGLMFECECNTVTTLADLLAAVKKKGYHEGLKAAYLHMADAKLLTPKGREVARKYSSQSLQIENQKLL